MMTPAPSWTRAARTGTGYNINRLRGFNDHNTWLGWRCVVINLAGMMVSTRIPAVWIAPTIAVPVIATIVTIADVKMHTRQCQTQAVGLCGGYRRQQYARHHGTQ
ncbi:hypothetical protein BJJ98_16270 [Dickeya solani]|nr:hypothetical protein A4U42_04740 [Dickeya solani IPO 2222]AUH09900.1 hypothetical protein BJD21_16300 [Dickeya solani D s0432-1]AUH13856.1 hypothetical protein BJJ98_16270 [Dickeya solani]